jgi:hypothetical protein
VASRSLADIISLLQSLVSCPSLAALAFNSTALTLTPLKMILQRKDDDGEAATLMRDVLQFDPGQHDPHETLMVLLGGDDNGLSALMRMELASRVRTTTRAEATSSARKCPTTPPCHPPSP